jgi:hypothetical protein
MSSQMNALGIDRLSVAERLQLLREMRDRLAAEGGSTPLIVRHRNSDEALKTDRHFEQGGFRRFLVERHAVRKHIRAIDIFRARP